MLKKKNWPNFQKILSSKFVTKLSKYRFGIRDPRSEIQDPGSGIWKNPISDPGSRGQKGTRSRIPDPGS
jgi:hypothetical protein